MRHFEKKTAMPVSAMELFDWHSRPGAFERLAPPWQAVSIAHTDGSLDPGSRVVLLLGRRPLQLKWVAEHTELLPGREFEDVQRSGPFAHWRHRHRFEPRADGESVLWDSVEYQLPLAWLSEPLAGGFAQRSLQRMFDYRHRTTLADLEFHRRYRRHPRLKVAVTDRDSALGSALAALLSTGGHEVIHLSRTTRAIGDEGVSWRCANGTLPTEKLEGIDALVDFSHQLGSARGRPTAEAPGGDGGESSSELRATVARLSRPPSVWVDVSTAACQGHDPPSTLNVPIVDGVESTRSVEGGGRIRVVSAQPGLVLSPRQGALARLLPLFQIGLGGRIPGGEGWVSWTGVDDAAAALAHILLTPELRGRVEIASPHPCRAAEFGPRLARVLKRPAALPFSASLLRLLLRGNHRGVCVGRGRIQPRKLLDSGFRFRYPTLEEALGHMLGKRR